MAAMCPFVRLSRVSGLLRATCKELRQLSDGLLEVTLRLDVTTELSAVQQQRPAAGWDSKCALLARCPRIHKLDLCMDATLPPDRLQQLSAAAGGRITHLELDLQQLNTHNFCSTLAMLPSLCPALRELSVSISLDSSVITLPADLPATLESLSLSIKQGEGDAPGSWPGLAGALGASTQLTQLHSLKVEFDFVAQDEQVDVSPLVPVATHLKNLHMGWDRDVSGGVSGLPQLLAACSHSLTSLALPFCAPAAPDQPSLAQVLAAAQNLQQLEVLPNEPVPLDQPLTAADVHALSTHPKLRRLVVRSSQLHSQLAAAALPPGSLQHMGLELHCYQYLYRPQQLLQLLSIGPLSAGCRLVYGAVGMLDVFLGRPPLDADLLSRLSQALSQPGLEIVWRVGVGGQVQGASVPKALGVIWVDVDGPLEQLPDQQAVAGLLGSLPGRGLYLDERLSATFCKEAETVRAGSSDGLWLLPALAHIRTLLVPSYRSDEVQRFAGALSVVMSHGYMPQLCFLACTIAPRDADLVAVAQLLKACCVRPGVQLIPSQGLRVAAINRLRAQLDAIPTPSSSTTDRQEGAACSCSEGAAGTQGQQSGVTLDDEGRCLLLQHLLC